MTTFVSTIVLVCTRDQVQFSCRVGSCKGSLLLRTFVALQGVDPAKPPPTLAHAFRTRGTVEGSIAIRNLTDMLESDTELTRFTAAKVQ
jgi:hypothetical protein